MTKVLGGTTHASSQPFDEVQALEIIRSLQNEPGAMLPILHALQTAFGFIDPQCNPLIAEALNVSKAEVHGVITFYHDFRTRPAGKHILKICRAESCQSMGVESLISDFEAVHDIKMGDTTQDGRLTIENVYCLGNCALGPAALLDGELIARLDGHRLEMIMSAAKGALQ